MARPRIRHKGQSCEKPGSGDHARPRRPDIDRASVPDIDSGSSVRPSDSVGQFQPPFYALQAAPQVSDLVSGDSVESDKVMIDRGKSGLDAGEAQAQLRLDVIQLGVDAAKHLGRQVFDVVSHGCWPCVACLGAILSLFHASGKGKEKAARGPLSSLLAGAGRPRSYLGKSDRPINHSSTARAHCRPSRIAQTTKDCPRRISPAPNTPGTEVW